MHRGDGGRLCEVVRRPRNWQVACSDACRDQRDTTQVLRKYGPVAIATRRGTSRSMTLCKTLQGDGARALGCQRPQSCRKATIGSSAAARRAGMYVASSATMTSSSAIAKERHGVERAHVEQEPGDDPRRPGGQHESDAPRPPPPAEDRREAPGRARSALRAERDANAHLARPPVHRVGDDSVQAERSPAEDQRHRARR